MVNKSGEGAPRTKVRYTICLSYLFEFPRRFRDYLHEALLVRVVSYLPTEAVSRISYFGALTTTEPVATGARSCSDYASSSGMIGGELLGSISRAIVVFVTLGTLSATRVCHQSRPRLVINAANTVLSSGRMTSQS